MRRREFLSILVASWAPAQEPSAVLLGWRQLEWSAVIDAMAEIEALKPPPNWVAEVRKVVRRHKFKAENMII